jgi:Mce-associated membrane protein
VPTKPPNDDETTADEVAAVDQTDADDVIEVDDAAVDDAVEDGGSVDTDDTDADDDVVDSDDGEVVVKERKRAATGGKSGSAKASSGKAGSSSKVSSSSTDSSSKDSAPGGRQITLSVRTLVLGLVGALVAFGLAFGVVDNIRVRGQLNDLRDQNANNAKAEQVAGEYAVRAATLDYKDLTPWAANLKKGVSGELSKQFDVAVPAMQQILTPIRMSTTATLVSSKTTDVAGDIYRVTAVVDVTTKSLQTPDGASSLAAYVLTLNKADNWMITAVGDQATPGAPRLPGMPQSGQQQQNTAPKQPTPAPGG